MTSGNLTGGAHLTKSQMDSSCWTEGHVPSGPSFALTGAHFVGCRLSLRETHKTFGWTEGLVGSVGGSPQNGLMEPL
jgi:hypothetical protein